MIYHKTYLQHSWFWWTNRRTIFFETFLVLTAFGWAVDLLITDVFNTNILYEAMRGIADQGTWAAFLLAWLVVYGFMVWRRHQSGRVACLTIIAGWWAFVATMLFLISPVSTGVVVYGSMSIVSAAAAVFNARKT
jgi:CHASE2 domain-containing sensor protein